MTEKEFNKLDRLTQLELLKAIDENYDDLDLDLAIPLYDKNGIIKNKKEVDKSLKKAVSIITTLWLANYLISKKSNKDTMVGVNIYVNTLKTPKTMISTKEWNKIMDLTIKKREKQVKIKQVINGNAKRLNKQVQNTVINGYKNGKKWTQISKELQEQFGYNKAKAKSIAITERNFYKSEAQLQAIKGTNITKTWIHNSSSHPREEHVAADGQVADEKGYFYVGGKRTEAPQHFRDPAEDINCHCTMRLEKSTEH